MVSVTLEMNGLYIWCTNMSVDSVMICNSNQFIFILSMIGVPQAVTSIDRR